jgi:hypothetical protein
VSRAFTLQAAPSDDRGVHHVDFVVGGTRVGSPGTAGGNGKGANATPAWTAQWESTRYWNGPQTVTAIAFDTSGNSASQAMSYLVQNVYATRTRTAHLCNPPTPTCPYYFGMDEYFGLQYPAVARLQVNWTYTRLDNYTGQFWGSVFNGLTQEIMFTRADSLDFYPSIELCGGCNNNAVGAGMTQVVKGKGGSAEADVTLTLTYPQ